MFKHFIKDIAARKAMILFSDTLLGRAMLRKGVELASRELGIPLEVQPDGTTSRITLTPPHPGTLTIHERAAILAAHHAPAGSVLLVEGE